MTHPEPLRNIWKHLNALDWNDDNFEAKKAFVAVLFCELTYQRIPNFEIDGTDKANLVPCAEFQEILASGEPIDFTEIMQSLDLGKFFVVERRYAITVGIITPTVIFIAIRGSHYLYEWINNFKAFKKYEFLGAKFHRKFFAEALSLIAPIERELSKIVGSNNSDIPIYITGHSLGGAIAAILNFLWKDGYCFHPVISRKGNNNSPKSCYTFGMPRYGDDIAVSNFSNPFHVFNNDDIVPTLPPLVMRYEDSQQEYQLSENAIKFLGPRPTGRFMGRAKAVFSKKAIPQHFMEEYRNRMSNVVRSSDSDC